MPESGEGRCMGETGLPWIDFPRVEIKNKGTAFVVDSPKCRLGEPIWKESEISAAGNGYFSAKEKRGGDRILHHIVIRQFIRKSGGIRDAVHIMVDGEDTRIVPKTQLLQDVQRPERFLGDGVGWRPVAEDRATAHFFENRLGLVGILAEFLSGKVVDPAVEIAVAANHVAAIGDIPDQLRIPFRDPAHDKKGGLDAMGSEELQDLTGVSLDPAFLPMPILRLDNSLEGRDMVVVLNINGEVVGDGWHGFQASIIASAKAIKSPLQSGAVSIKIGRFLLLFRSEKENGISAIPPGSYIIPYLILSVVPYG